MPKAESRVPPEKLALYDALIATLPGVERKGAANAYTSLNGHMTSYMDADGVLALRLPPAEREAFLTQYDATLRVAYGIVQKEYVAVPDAMLADTAGLAPWFAASYAHVGTLTPKPTRRPAKS
jgi:hypothetical protein